MSSDVEPGTAWKLASDLRRFDEWMTIFGGWRGTVPSTIAEGTRVSSCIKVKPAATSRNPLNCKAAAEAGFGSRWR